MPASNGGRSWLRSPQEPDLPRSYARSNSPSVEQPQIVISYRIKDVCNNHFNGVDGRSIISELQYGLQQLGYAVFAVGSGTPTPGGGAGGVSLSVSGGRGSGAGVGREEAAGVAGGGSDGGGGGGGGGKDSGGGGDPEESLRAAGLVAKAISVCEVVIVVCTPGYGETKVTLRELDTADRLRRRVVPLWLSGAYPPPAVEAYLGSLPRLPKGALSLSARMEAATRNVGQTHSHTLVAAGPPARRSDRAAGVAASGGSMVAAGAPSPVQDLLAELTALLRRQGCSPKAVRRAVPLGAPYLPAVSPRCRAKLTPPGSFSGAVGSGGVDSEPLPSPSLSPSGRDACGDQNSGGGSGGGDSGDGAAAVTTNGSSSDGNGVPPITTAWPSTMSISCDVNGEWEDRETRGGGVANDDMAAAAAEPAATATAASDDGGGSQGGGDSPMGRWAHARGGNGGGAAPGACPSWGSQQDALMKACLAYDMVRIRQLLAAGVSADVADESGWTALHRAAYRGNVVLTEVLLRAGANVGARTQLGDTPLHVACRQTNPLLVRVLLEAGAELDGRGQAGQTPLHAAASWGRGELVAELLAAGADKEAADETGNTPYHLAARGGEVEAARLLGRAGASKQALNKSGLTPLDYLTTATTSSNDSAAAGSSFPASHSSGPLPSAAPPCGTGAGLRASASGAPPVHGLCGPAAAHGGGGTAAAPAGGGGTLREERSANAYLGARGQQAGAGTGGMSGHGTGAGKWWEHGAGGESHGVVDSGDCMSPQQPSYERLWAPGGRSTLGRGSPGRVHDGRNRRASMSGVLPALPPLLVPQGSVTSPPRHRAPQPPAAAAPAAAPAEQASTPGARRGGAAAAATSQPPHLRGKGPQALPTLESAPHAGAGTGAAAGAIGCGDAAAAAAAATARSRRASVCGGAGPSACGGAGFGTRCLPAIPRRSPPDAAIAGAAAPASPLQTPRSPALPSPLRLAGHTAKQQQQQQPSLPSSLQSSLPPPLSPLSVLFTSALAASAAAAFDVVPAGGRRGGRASPVGRPLSPAAVPPPRPDTTNARPRAKQEEQKDQPPPPFLNLPPPPPPPTVVVEEAAAAPAVVQEGVEDGRPPEAAQVAGVAAQAEMEVEVEVAQKDTPAAEAFPLEPRTPPGPQDAEEDEGDEGDEGDEEEEEAKEEEAEEAGDAAKEEQEAVVTGPGVGALAPVSASPSVKARRREDEEAAAAEAAQAAADSITRLESWPEPPLPPLAPETAAAETATAAAAAEAVEVTESAGNPGADAAAGQLPPYGEKEEEAEPEAGQAPAAVPAPAPPPSRGKQEEEETGEEEEATEAAADAGEAAEPPKQQAEPREPEPSAKPRAVEDPAEALRLEAAVQDSPPQPPVGEGEQPPPPAPPPVAVAEPPPSAVTLLQAPSPRPPPARSPPDDEVIRLGDDPPPAPSAPPAATGAAVGPAAEEQWDPEPEEEEEEADSDPDLDYTLRAHPTIPPPDGPVLLIVLSGVADTAAAGGAASAGGTATAADRHNALLAAAMPALNAERAAAASTGRFRTLRAHGAAVGLLPPPPPPTAAAAAGGSEAAAAAAATGEVFAHSEASHLTLASGRVLPYSSTLVDATIASGALFRSAAWRHLRGNCNGVGGGAASGAGPTLHLIGLLSDGGVHSHVRHLTGLLRGAAPRCRRVVGVPYGGCSSWWWRRIRLHVLLDGRDVPDGSSVVLVDELECQLAALRAEYGIDARIASGGGRMRVTMDRYECDWSVVRRGWEAHVRGAAPHSFTDPLTAVIKLRGSEAAPVSDQHLEPFVIVEEEQTTSKRPNRQQGIKDDDTDECSDDVSSGDDDNDDDDDDDAPTQRVPVGAIEDGDVVLLFNFRSDRMVGFARALQAPDDGSFDAFDRGRVPKDLRVVGLTRYDTSPPATSRLPYHVLVPPPAGRCRTLLCRFLAANGLRSLAAGEAAAVGHLTFMWSGCRRAARTNKSHGNGDGGDDSLDEQIAVPSEPCAPGRVPAPRAPYVAAAVRQALQEERGGGSRPYRLIRVILADPDLAAHTGDLAATVRACEAVDSAIRELIEAVDSVNGRWLLTSDHGSADDMVQRDKWGCPLYDDDGRPLPYPGHTSSPVPCLVGGSGLPDRVRFRRDLPEGGLANVASTLLNLMGFEAPEVYEPSLVEA